jgi:hypothetical protein
MPCHLSEFTIHMYSGHVVKTIFVHRLEHNKELSRSQCSLILDLLLKSAMKERSCDDIFMAACNLQDLQCLIMIMIGNL